ncbi:unnamed protein product [Paramecium primaurelia]|uniref:Uncharacterized protein n=1 Tax=Paramecium primaurelia TaxID=5886 RepID=A0A8S1QVA7_PARPR|nr:unnamed protein product [Paramecium primaurelia]
MGFRKRLKSLKFIEKLMSLQMQFLQKAKRQNFRRNVIYAESNRFLQKQITQEINVNKREQQLQEIDEITEKLDEYIQNISDMGQQLRLINDFLNHIRKRLLRVEGKINQMKDQLNSMGNDINF